MGTNYELRTPPCQHCGRSDKIMHIGKESAGWCFSLHVYPELGIYDLDDWRERWKSGEIRDEDGAFIPLSLMERIITERPGPDAFAVPPVGTERGPNGAWRHHIDGFCVRHGAGPWDCMVGEFS